MIHTATTHPFFTDLNHHSYIDPKAHILNMDAFLFLRKSTETYDAVIVDFPLPFETELVKLFSSEFYHMLARHVRPDGYVVMDVPMGCFRRDPTDHGSGRWRAMLPLSLNDAGFKNVVSYCSSDGFLLARLDDQIPQTEFFDVGLKFSVIDTDFLYKALHTDLPPTLLRDPSDFNSIFKPLQPLKPRDL
jgi:spermidine synthase